MTIQRPPSTFLVANWNIEWNTTSSRAGKLISELLDAAFPDIACLTESNEDQLAHKWQAAYSDADHGYPIRLGRRKVVLWSRAGWRSVSVNIPDAPPGRFVSGVTDTALGPIRVHGVCVPWRDAHVRTGNRSKQVWEEHISFLRALLDWRGLRDTQYPTIILGDFNQPIPPKGAPREARDLFGRLLADFPCLPNLDQGKRSVCHTLLDPSLTGCPVQEFPSALNGIRLSDHHGHLYQVQRA